MKQNVKYQTSKCGIVHCISNLTCQIIYCPRGCFGHHTHSHTHIQGSYFITQSDGTEVSNRFRDFESPNERCNPPKLKDITHCSDLYGLPAATPLHLILVSLSSPWKRMNSTEEEREGVFRNSVERVRFTGKEESDGWRLHSRKKK